VVATVAVGVAVGVGAGPASAEVASPRRIPGTSRLRLNFVNRVIGVISSVALSARGYDPFKSLQPAHASATNSSRILEERDPYRRKCKRCASALPSGRTKTQLISSIYKGDSAKRESLESTCGRTIPLVWKIFSKSPDHAQSADSGNFRWVALR
jgi:hypothetical protein